MSFLPFRGFLPALLSRVLMMPPALREEIHLVPIQTFALYSSPWGAVADAAIVFLGWSI
jgi:hypothetical protein